MSRVKPWTCNLFILDLQPILQPTDGIIQLFPFPLSFVPFLRSLQTFRERYSFPANVIIYGSRKISY